MHPVDHAQAVEAAKQVRELIQQYARPDYYHFLLDPVGQQTDPTKRAKEAMALLDAILSTPGPSRDAATAETCREFVWRLMAASMRHAATRGEGETEREVMAEKFTAELLAMFAGGTGDDVEAVTREWFEKEIGDGDWEVWREDDRCDRVSVFLKGIGDDERTVVHVRVQDNEAGPEHDAWAPMPHVKTRGDVRRLCHALGIPTEPAK